MKKDEKFLKNLSNELSSVSKKKREAIVLKYRNIIDEQLNNKKKILSILKELGTPEEVAKEEIEKLKSNNIFKKIFTRNKKSKDELENDSEYTKELVKEINEEDKKEKKEEIEKKVKKIKTKTKKKVKKVKKSTKKAHKKININIKNSVKNSFNRVGLFFKGIALKIKSIFKKKEVKKDIIDKTVEEAKNTLEEVTDKKIFESKKKRIIRISLKTLGVVLVLALLFSLLWTSSIFVASLFALLDGIKFYGINIALCGIVLLNLWIFIIVNNYIFNKKISFKISLISIIIIVILIGSGIALGVREYSKVTSIDDVSEKYSMNTSFEKYNLSKDPKKVTYITFNSNYKTTYIVEYDNSLSNSYKVEVKYYECYYDLFIKKASNNLYISLGVDYRDLLSVYIDNLKDGKIFNKEELSRYTVRVIMNENDKDRIIIK